MVQFRAMFALVVIVAATIGMAQAGTQFTQTVSAILDSAVSITLGMPSVAFPAPGLVVGLNTADAGIATVAANTGWDVKAYDPHTQQGNAPPGHMRINLEKYLFNPLEVSAYYKGSTVNKDLTGVPQLIATGGPTPPDIGPIQFSLHQTVLESDLAGGYGINIIYTISTTL